MNLSIRHPLEMDKGRWALPINYHCVGKCLKSAATITAVASAVLASLYLAYQDPGRWLLTTVCVSLINLYVLPKVLHYGNPTLIKIALIVNLSMIGSLGLGGISVASYALIQKTFIFFKIYEFSTALSLGLFSTFLATGLLGYGVPFSINLLEKAQDLLNNQEKWQNRTAKLYEYFHKTPEIGLGFLQTNLWKNFLIQCAVLAPEPLLNFIEFFSLTPPDYIWALSGMSCNPNKLKLFENMLTKVEEEAYEADILGEVLETKVNFYQNLINSLQYMTEQELSEAISLLLSHGTKLIPSVLSKEEFLEIFIEIDLDTVDLSIQQFLDSISSWQDLKNNYQSLSLKVDQLEQEMQIPLSQQISKEQEKDFSQRQKQINEDFIHLRTAIEKVYLNKRIWQDFATLWNTNYSLPFKQGNKLLIIFQDQNLLQEIDNTYLSMLGKENQQTRNLSKKIEMITNKLFSIQEKEEKVEPISALLFLGGHQGFSDKSFVLKDYENLQEWFNLDSPHLIDAEMEKIGLRTEEDLYVHEILPRQGTSLKTEVCKKLKDYIKKCQLANRVKPLEKVEKSLSVSRVIEKVTRAIYYAIESALILVPVLIYPYAAGVGFSLGTCYFILKRFNILEMELSFDFEGFIENHFVLNLSRAFINNRLILSFNPSRRAGANAFVSANLIDKIRILNLKILSSLFVAYCGRIVFKVGELSFLGALFQGISFADEVVNLA